MAKYTQTNRPLAVTTPLGDDALLLVGFTGTEALSELFHFQLDLLAEKDTDVPFDRLLGQAASVRLSLPNKGNRYFSGIVRRFGQGGPVTAADGKTTFLRYRAEVAPQLWLLTRTTQSRIFQQMSVPDILKQVLQQQWKLDVSFEIQGDFAPRDYCVQYRESDFAFVSRLMEEEGIYYFFTHTAGGHQLVLANTPQSHPEVPGSSTITYETDTGGLRDEDRIQTWEKFQEVRSGKYTVWDYCFEMPKKNLAADRTIADAVPVGRVTHKLRVAGNEQFEIYQYPGGYAQRFDGVAPSGQDRAADLPKIFQDNGRTAAIRIQEEAVPGLVVTGQCNCRNFVSGHRFALQRHFNADGEYVLTRVEHAMRMEGTYLTGEEKSLDYRNRFQCIPLALPFRPARVTPKPVIPGTQTAVVVGPAGEDIFLDKYGRVKVQFHWDREGKKDANSSCWVRVGQVWAGQRWGAFFWPRVGHEVIVAFEEGDPDQPIVVGSVYNAANMPPFALPGQSMVGGIKSCSFSKDASAGENFNGLVFHDQYGDEHVQIHSENHEISNSESSRYSHVGSRHTQVVGGFHLPGSGSGGGDAGEDIKKGFEWVGTKFPGNYGFDYTLTVGEGLEVYLGLDANTVLGDYLEVVVNPLGFIAELGPAFGAADSLTALQAFAKGLGAMMGALTFVVGSDTTFCYGPHVDIVRGNKIEMHGHWDLATGFLVGTTAAAYLATGIFAGLDTGNEYTNLAVGLGGTGAAMVLMGILSSVECTQAYAANAKAKADAAADLATTIHDAVLQMAPAIAGAAERSAAAAATLADQAVAAAAGLATQQAAAQAAQALNNTRTFLANYQVNAFDITLRSAFDPAVAAAAVAVPPAATAIVIDAQGLGPDFETGTVSINGTQQASMSSGPATVGVYSAVELGNVVINCGPTGLLTLQRGPEPDLQVLQFEEGAITMVQYAPGNITIQVMEGTIRIQSGAAVIVLNGETGEISIEGGTINLTALEAINLTVEENSFAVNAAGVEITGLTNKIQAEVALQLQAAAGQVQAEGEWLNAISMDLFQ